jgi:hypothetical protein
VAQDNGYKKKLAELGELRFPTGAEFEKEIQGKVPEAVRRMLGNLADNYPEVPTTKIAQLYSAFCTEREKALKSAQLIADDQFYTKTRPEFLFQILGDLLFVDEKAGGAQYTDETYRAFLLKVKKAYFGGSTLSNINGSLSDILGVPVVVKEMYLDARKKGVRASIKDVHRLIAEIFMKEGGTGTLANVGTYIQDMYYFIDLIKPATSIFETHLIWEESYAIGGCPGGVLTEDANGNREGYVYTDLPNRVFALYQIGIGDIDSLQGLVSDEWVEGVILDVDTYAGVITLQGGTELVINPLTLVYTSDVDGVYRTEIEELAPGQQVLFLGREAQGSFIFHEGATPQEIQDNWYAQFNPLVIESPVFQANVVKERDEHGDRVAIKACGQNIMAQDKRNVLLPMYEDMRDNCDYPTPKLRKLEIVVPRLEGYEEGDGVVTIPAGVTIGSTEDPIIVEGVPIVNKEGEVAVKEDIVVYLDGQLVEGAVLSVEPWEGVILLSFIPPAGSRIEIQYYTQGAYPVQVSQEYVEYLPPSEEGPFLDLKAKVSSISGEGHVIRFQWPFPLVDKTLYGNAASYQIAKYPLLGKEGNLASVEDIKVYLNGVELTGAIEFIRPLLGHVQLTFTPPLGMPLEIVYYYQDKKRTYPFITNSDQHFTNTVYGSRSPFTLETNPDVPEGKEFNPNANLDQYRKPLEISYRFRAFDSTQSSVVSSKDTGVLNAFEIPGKKGSWAGSMNNLNRYNVHFSGEYLYDTNKYIELNDDYLFNNLKALLVLRKGIPPFYRSFTSTASYAFRNMVENGASVDEAFGFNVPAGVTVENRPSGLIEYVSTNKYIEKGRAKIFTGLKEALTSEGYDVQLSSLCDDRGFELGFKVEEEYYPNREVRLNDYKDYIERIAGDALEGSLKAIQGSPLLKAGVGVDWRYIQKGSLIQIDGIEYTISNVRDRESLVISRPFLSEKGDYDFIITPLKVEKIDVLLNAVVRRCVVPIGGLFPTGFPLQQDYLVTAFPDPDPDPYPRNKNNPNLPIPASPLLTSDISDEGGEAQFLLDEDTADKMVKFRNWDQSLIVINPGIIEEEFQDPMDDTSEGSVYLYWSIGDADFVEYTFRGLVLMTREEVGEVSAADYPHAVVALKNDEDTQGLSDTTMTLVRVVVRQVLDDNSVDMLAFDELVRIPPEPPLVPGET